jgi:predicted aspartyl protease
MNEAPCGYDHALNGPALLVRHGPSLKVDVGYDQNYVAGYGGFPKPDAEHLDALIDTGASDTFIDEALASDLKLPLIDRADVSTVRGVERVNIYLGQMRVVAADGIVIGKFAAVRLRSSGIDVDAVLGRTFLQNYVFLYDGTTGKATLRRPYP